LLKSCSSGGGEGRMARTKNGLVRADQSGTGRQGPEKKRQTKGGVIRLRSSRGGGKKKLELRSGQSAGNKGELTLGGKKKWTGDDKTNPGGGGKGVGGSLRQGNSENVGGGSVTAKTRERPSQRPPKGGSTAGKAPRQGGGKQTSRRIGWGGGVWGKEIRATEVSKRSGESYPENATVWEDCRNRVWRGPKLQPREHNRRAERQQPHENPTNIISSRQKGIQGEKRELKKETSNPRQGVKRISKKTTQPEKEKAQQEGGSVKKRGVQGGRNVKTEGNLGGIRLYPLAATGLQEREGWTAVAKKKPYQGEETRSSPKRT